jgi:hypothetical protein
MTRTLPWLLTLATLAATSPVAAQTVLGHLELQWGDPSPQALAQFKSGQSVHGAPRFEAVLLTDRGQRIALDPEQARRAAGDLYALSGRRVAVDCEPSTAA